MTATPLMRAPEVAKWLNLTTARVYELTRIGAIPSIRIGRQVRYDRERLQAWLAGGGAPLSDEAA